MDQNDNNLDGLEIETGRRKPIDDYSPDNTGSDEVQDVVDKDSIRDEIKTIEKEIESLTNTFNYGDDERLSFLEGKLDSLRIKLLRDDS